jgi:hypothetical protein
MYRQAYAICDGVDDQVEIQAAINSLPITGGTVIIAKGIYIFDDAESLGYCLQIAKSNVKLIIEPGATLFLKNNCLSGAKITNIIRIGDGENAYENIEIEGGGIIDGNEDNNPSTGSISDGAAIRIHGRLAGVRISDLIIQNATRDAIYSRGAGTDDADRASNITIERCQIINPAEGILWERTNDMSVVNCYILECREQDGIEPASDCTRWLIRGNFIRHPGPDNFGIDIYAMTGINEDGICTENQIISDSKLGYISGIGGSSEALIRNIIFSKNIIKKGGLYLATGSPGVKNIIISQNRFQEGAGNGIYVGPYLNGCQIDGNSISEYDYDGIQLYTGHISIIGNHIFNNGQAGLTTQRVGIGMADDIANGVLIHDNRIYDDQDTPTQTYPVLGNGISNISIKDNHSFGHLVNDTPTITNPGSNVDISGNMEY